MKLTIAGTIILILFFLFSIIIALIYLLYFVNRLIISKILLLFCVFYLSLFFFLQFLVNMDFIINESNFQDSSKELFNKYFNGFYYSFNIFSYILKYIVFYFYSGYSKSGFLYKRRKCFDAIFYHYKLLIVAGIFLTIIMIIFIIFKDPILNFYGTVDLSFINYLNYMGLLELYFNIGFFFIHIIPDFKINYYEACTLKYFSFMEEKMCGYIYDALPKFKKAHNKVLKAFNNSLLKTLLLKDLKPLFDKIERKKTIFEMHDKSKETNSKNNSLSDNETEINNSICKLQSFDDSTLILEKDIYQMETDLSIHIRKFKSKARKIEKIKYLLSEVKLKIDFINQRKNQEKKYKIIIIVKYIVFFLIGCIIIISEVFCCILNMKGSSSKHNNADNSMFNNTSGNQFENTKNTFLEEKDYIGFFQFIGYIFIIIIFVFINSSYTIAVFFALNRRKFISGDFFYGSKRGDNLNLIETIKTISGLAFPLAYCNLYFFYFIYTKKNGKSRIYIYDFIKTPELNTGELNWLPIIKILLICVFAVITNCYEKIFSFKINDFADYDKSVNK